MSTYGNGLKSNNDRICAKIGILPVGDGVLGGLGNTDRHHGNWAFIADENSEWLKLSPLYDNGSSLCYLERLERIEQMQKDARMLDAALYTKSKSQIGLGDIRPVNHFDLFLFFANRLFDKSRPDLPQLLKKYGLDDYDEWELLKATKAKMMTDGYELTPNLAM